MVFANGSGVHRELLAYRRPPTFASATTGLHAMAFADRVLWSSALKISELADPDGHLHRVTRR